MPNHDSFEIEMIRDNDTVFGSSFGMYHDTEKIGCSKRDGDTLHVMTPTFEVDTIGVAWSRCSRRDITNFLE